MQQHNGFITAVEMNSRFRHLLERGISTLCISFDRPTETGHDSDHPFAEGAVGKHGVSINSIRDMEELFASIPLEEMTLSMVFHPTAFITLAFYAAMAKNQGVDLNKISGGFQPYISHENITRVRYIYPPGPSERIHADLKQWSKNEIPGWNPDPDQPLSPHCNTSLADINNQIQPYQSEEMIRAIQIEKISLLRKQRDPARCDHILQLLNDQAASDENLMPTILKAAEEKCTLGEIADTLREIFGELIVNGQLPI